MAVKSTQIDFKFNQAVVKAIRGIGPVVLDQIAQEAQSEIMKKSPVKTGTNKRSVQTDAPSTWTRRVFTTSGYGLFLETGTGLFGPKRKVIRPRTAKAMRWKGAGGGWAFAKTIKGMRARPYFRPGFDAMRKRLPEILKDAARGEGL